MISMSKFAVTSISTVDWPGQVCGVVWTFGCNFRCPFCYNSELVQGSRHSQPTFTIEELVAGFERRRPLIDGVCISGGEPTIAKGIGTLIIALKEAEFAVKIDTNGSQPSMVEYMADIGIDYLAIDIKTHSDGYAKLTHTSLATSFKHTLRKTLDAALGKIPQVELRTTVVPTLNDKAAPAIAEWLAPYASMISVYSVQPFIPGRSMRADLDSLPRTDYQMLVDFAAPLQEVGFTTRITTPTRR